MIQRNFLMFDRSLVKVCLKEFEWGVAASFSLSFAQMQHYELEKYQSQKRHNRHAGKHSQIHAEGGNPLIEGDETSLRDKSYDFDRH